MDSLVTNKSKIFLAITKIVELQHNMKAVHQEIEQSCTTSTKHLPKKTPTFDKISRLFAEKDKRNIILLEKLKPLLEKNPNANTNEYIKNYLQYMEVLEEILLNARMILGYIDFIKRRYTTLRFYFTGTDILETVTLTNLNAFLSGWRFQGLPSLVGDTYKALLIVVRGEVLKRNNANIELDFITILKEPESSYNMYIRAFIELHKKHFLKKSASKRPLSEIQTITYNALRDAYVFQKNKIIKDIYCSENSSIKPELDRILKEFEANEFLLKSVVPAQNELQPRFQNFPQYFVLYPFGCINPQKRTITQIIEHLGLSHLGVSSNLPLLSQLRQIQLGAKLKFIILNKYPVSAPDLIVVYHDIYDPRTRELNEQISHKISRVKELDYQLNTVSGFLYKNINKLKQERNETQAAIDTLIQQRDKGLADKKAELSKNVGAVNLTLPATVEKPVPPRDEDIIFGSDDRLLHFDPTGFLKDPNGYVVLFSDGTKLFEILENSQGGGIFKFFVDIPGSVGLYKLLRERYSLDKLSFIQPSRYLNYLVNEFRTLDDRKNDINSGYIALLDVYKKMVQNPVPQVQRVRNINRKVKEALNREPLVIHTRDNESLKMAIFEKLFVLYMTALKSVKELSDLVDRQSDDAYLGAIKDAGVAFVLRFDELYLQNLSPDATQYTIQPDDVLEVNNSLNLDRYLNKVYVSIRVSQQKKVDSEFMANLRLAG